MSSLFLIFVSEMRERFNKLVLGAIDWVFLLKEGIKLVFLCFSIGVLLHVDGVLKDFRVVHGAPSNQTAMIGEGGELVFLDVAMNSLLDVKVLAHLLT